MRKSIEERFMKYVEFDPNSGCWLWNGYIANNYGRFRIDANTVKTATHVSLELFKGTTKPDGLVVCHSCNTPSCVNPDHLSYDTQANNAKYMVDCGRSSKGVLRYSAKLDEDKVREIRLKVASGKLLKDIAEEYGVTFQTISKIKLRDTWGHVI